MSLVITHKWTGRKCCSRDSCWCSKSSSSLSTASWCAMTIPEHPSPATTLPSRTSASWAALGARSKCIRVSYGGYLYKSQLAVLEAQAAKLSVTPIFYARSVAVLPAAATWRCSSLGANWGNYNTSGSHNTFQLYVCCGYSFTTNRPSF